MAGAAVANPTAASSIHFLGISRLLLWLLVGGESRDAARSSPRFLRARRVVAAPSAALLSFADTPAPAERLRRREESNLAERGTGRTAGPRLRGARLARAIALPTGMS